MSRRWQLVGRWGAEKACFIHFHQELLFEISESFSDEMNPLFSFMGGKKTVKLKKKLWGFRVRLSTTPPLYADS